jgi:hypothetical protein
MNVKGDKICCKCGSSLYEKPKDVIDPFPDEGEITDPKISEREITKDNKVILDYIKDIEIILKKIKHKIDE